MAICRNGRSFLSQTLMLAISVILLSSLVSCSGGDIRPDDVLIKNKQTVGSSVKVDKFNVRLASHEMSNKKNFSNDYLIGPEDLLDINVFQVDELKTSVRVSGNGFIKLPLIGAVKAQGYTVSQLEKIIAKKLDKYLESPTVSVFVREYRSQQISVLGSVKEPKIYYVTGQTHLLDVLSLAGGLTPEAGNVCIVQRFADTKSEKKVVIDLDELLVNGHSELNVPVYSGDIVVVPQSGIFFVDGAVKGPGSFPLKGKITLTQAITMAKGLAFEAKTSDIKIYRDTGKAEREVIAVNYNSILKGKSPDMAINDKDVIIVPRNGFKSFIKGLAGSLRLGSFSLGTPGY